LLLDGHGVPFMQDRPLAYQLIEGVRRIVQARYVLEGTHTVGIRVGPHDPARPLTIDPVLRFASYLGDLTSGSGVAIDGSGSMYLAGETASPSFPGPGGAQPFHGESDLFVAKLNPAGNALV